MSIVSVKKKGVSFIKEIKFSVGLPVVEKEGFTDKIIEYKDRISEVYFSFGDFPNGRSAHGAATPFDSLTRQTESIRTLASEGLSFNLLFNANCYGEESLSRAFFCKIGDTVDYIGSICSLTSVTTTSPIIAKFIKSNFEGLETRASVNMEIGSPEGFDYLGEYFDGYYMKREHNRSLGKIKELRRHLDAAGKKMYLLANSGCLNNCSAHIYHDNLVAHEAQMAKYDNAYDFFGICHDYLKRDGAIEDYLRLTNFIRPEDIRTVAEYFDGIKLATRVNPYPVRVLEAYMSARFHGAVTSLLEPDHSSVFYPKFIANDKIPEDYLNRVLECNKSCRDCGYCKKICVNATVNTEEL